MSACPACDSSEATPLPARPPKPWKLGVCGGCGLVHRQNPVGHMALEIAFVWEKPCVANRNTADLSLLSGAVRKSKATPPAAAPIHQEDKTPMLRNALKSSLLSALAATLLAGTASAQDPSDATGYSQFLGTACIVDGTEARDFQMARIMAKSAGFTEMMADSTTAMLSADGGIMLTLTAEPGGGIACNNMIPGTALDAAGHDALFERTRRTLTSLYGVPETTVVTGGETWRVAGSSDNTISVQMTRQGDTTIIDARSSPGAP